MTDHSVDMAKGMFYEEELSRYKVKFNKAHWFFQIHLRKEWDKKLIDFVKIYEEDEE